MDLLTINKKDSSVKDDEGPSVDSENRDERIQARRLRIKKKNELEEKKRIGSTGPAESEKKIELTKGRKQIQGSRARLVKLENDGLELVSNVRVAADAREHTRRSEEEEQSRLRKERLEQEAKSAAEKFEEIVKKWETAQSKEIPQELHEMLMDQKQLCDSMIEEKNKLINDFKQELKYKDDIYVKALKKYAEDIDLLIERMKDQTYNMRKFYMEELVNIENAFINERKDLLDKHRKEWDEKMEERKTKEIAFLEERFKRVERNENELNMLRVKDSEEYNEIKIKLENDLQIMEQRLQQMKATYQLNQEKLEYNFQVIQKRDEENTKTKAQQKRKITKLQDVLTSLKKKLAKQIKQYNDESQQLAEEYKRVTDMFNDMQTKSKHFLAVDLKKFHDIWIMNEEQCKILSNNLLEADRIIHEQQLGLEWTCPDISFMKNLGPINGSDQSKTGNDYINELFQTDDEMDEEDEAQREETSKSELDNESVSRQETFGLEKKSSKISKEGTQFKEESRDIILNLNKNSLRTIIMIICDEAGFLLEQKLVNLIEPLEKNEKSMVKLDSIFKALGVETENDVKLLAQYFISHRNYQELMKNKAFIERTKSEMENEGSKADENLTNRSKNDDKMTIPSDHIELIDPNEVVTALKTFLKFHHKHENHQKKLSKFRLENLDNRDDSADAEYWKKYENLISSKKEKLWDAMLYSLQKYHGVLNKRVQLIDENKALANQNMELRMLLAQYMQSNINQELEIPPTKILQMEYSK
ncbi:Dynein regulatory complex 1 [Brachionus plicatilis]|uniref:Dynein regulatory complex 1 n=1 Tax=Brachionus plicatilis TaxID=10195 RepID=A0A3M7P5T1_BRAPC|nr:Dynein regulatory complex 1 [Brachionus plicatilis]